MEHNSEISFRPSYRFHMREKFEKFCSSDWRNKQTSIILTNDGMPRSFQVKKTCFYVMIVKSYLKIWVHFLALGSIFLLTLHCDNSFRIPVDIFKNWWWHKMFLKNIYISFCRVFISAKQTSFLNNSTIVFISGVVQIIF